MGNRRVLARSMGEGKKPLIFRIDMSKGVGTTFTIPATASLIYNYDVKWGDGSSSSNQNLSSTHDYGVSSGVFEIEIKGVFPQFYFANVGDKLKLISIQQWGDIEYSADQYRAFYGCSNLTSLADDIEWINSVTSAIEMFRDTNCPMPNGVTFSSLVTATGMFYNTKFTTLPDSVTFASLVGAPNMFHSALIEVIPDGVTFSNVLIGNSMFRYSKLTALPSSVTFYSLTNGGYMFNNSLLNALPNGMILPNLLEGSFMFQNSKITTLPSGMTLNNVSTARDMFRSTLLASLPISLTLANLTNGQNMFFGVTINTVDYSQLLNNMDANNINTGVDFNGGGSKYNSSAVTARNNLISTKSWTITDGGLG